jgi:CDP-glycerol glycerophosphotransferase
MQAPVPLRKRIKRFVWKVGMAIGKRSIWFRTLVRWILLRLRTASYRRVCRHNPVDPKVVTFESFMGRYYTDSPKALYKAMLADPRFDDYTLIWAFRKPEDFVDEPELARATFVKYRSKEHMAVYAKAGAWFSNSVTPSHVSPRDGQKLSKRARHPL